MAEYDKLAEVTHKAHKLTVSNVLQAVLGGQGNIVEQLTKTHISLMQQDASGMTMLACAVQLQHVHLVKELLKLWDQAVSVDLPNTDGRTALHHAADCLVTVHKEIADAHMLNQDHAVHEVNAINLSAAQVS